MPRIPDGWLKLIVYIYNDEDAADAGDEGGGSGFVVSNPLSETGPGRRAHVLYMVTNSHVVARRDSFVRVNRKSGGVEVIRLPTPRWIHHPAGDDLAVAPLPPPYDDLDVLSLPRAVLLTEERIAEAGLGTGDETFVIGRFQAIGSPNRNSPAVRFGRVSVMPAEPYPQAPLRNHVQDSFFVEAVSLPGYSGSPVFIYPSGSIANDGAGGFKIQLKTDTSLSLLGVDWGHIQGSQRIVEPVRQSGHPDGYYVPLNSGMMMVVPAMKLGELLDHPGLSDVRRQLLEREMPQLEEMERRAAIENPTPSVTDEQRREAETIVKRHEKVRTKLDARLQELEAAKRVIDLVQHEQEPQDPP